MDKKYVDVSLAPLYLNEKGCKKIIEYNDMFYKPDINI